MLQPDHEQDEAAFGINMASLVFLLGHPSSLLLLLVPLLSGCLACLFVYLFINLLFLLGMSTSHSRLCKVPAGTLLQGLTELEGPKKRPKMLSPVDLTKAFPEMLEVQVDYLFEQARTHVDAAVRTPAVLQE